MKQFLMMICIVSCSAALAADLTTRYGQTYRNYEVIGQSDLSIDITYTKPDGSVALKGIPKQDLPDDLQKRFHYNPEIAAEQARLQAQLQTLKLEEEVAAQTERRKKAAMTPKKDAAPKVEPGRGVPTKRTESASSNADRADNSRIMALSDRERIRGSVQVLKRFELGSLCRIVAADDLDVSQRHLGKEIFVFRLTDALSSSRRVSLYPTGVKIDRDGRKSIQVYARDAQTAARLAKLASTMEAEYASKGRADVPDEYLDLFGAEPPKTETTAVQQDVGTNYFYVSSAYPVYVPQRPWPRPPYPPRPPRPHPPKPGPGPHPQPRPPTQTNVTAYPGNVTVQKVTPNIVIPRNP